MHKQPNMHNYSQALKSALQDWSHWPILGVLQQSDCEFTLLDKGLTNENWLVCTSKSNHKNDSSLFYAQKFVIRINAPNAIALNINRQAEWVIQGILAKAHIITPYLFRQQNDQYWIRPFVHGETLASTLSKNQALNSATLQAVSHHLRAIHNTSCSDLIPTIIFAERTNYYWQQIFESSAHQATEIRSQLNTLKASLDAQLNKQSYTASLCHMDTNINNWISAGDKLELIDWEYAAIGNPAWDLAVFCESAQLNRAQAKFLLASYGAINTEQLQYANKQMQYLSALWFAVQQNTEMQTFICQLTAINC